MAKPIKGSKGNDNIVGTPGNDKLKGKHGDDRLKGREGDDSIDGGKGFDTAVYSGSFFDYDIERQNGNKTTVTDTNTADGDEGTDTLKRVEALEFNDVTIYLDGRNNAPIAQDDAAATHEDTPVVIDVLANDADFDGDALSVSGIIVSGSEVSFSGPGDTIVLPSGAEVTLNNDGTLTYTPADVAGDTTETQTFTYVVADAHGAKSEADVNVAVQGFYDAPDGQVQVYRGGVLVATYSTIGAAIGDASTIAGDTVVVGAGTYAEGGITLDKDLTIVGANAGKAGQDPTREPESELVGAFYVTAAGATIDGMQITYDGANVGGSFAAIAIAAGTAGVTITNSVLEDGASGQYGIVTPWGGNVTGLNVTDNLISDFFFGSYWNPSTQVTATGNVYSANAADPMDDLAPGSNISDNTFINGDGALGYGVFDAVEDVGAIIGPNNLGGERVGIFAYGPGPQTITGTVNDDVLIDASGAAQTFRGAGGNDTYYGDASGDTFLFAAPEANNAVTETDTIEDYSLSQGDQIVLSGVTGTAAQDGADVVITLDTAEQDLIVVRNTTVADVNAGMVMV